ncbi:helix-turn-helix domain-containing protein [Niastella caeni]|nr:AraC family transcriptional regulator [Niastella caeni]
MEERTKETNEYDTGQFVFYNKGEKHNNKNYQPGSCIFNIDISDAWFRQHDVQFSDQSIVCINDPSLKILVVRMLKEYAEERNHSFLEIESLLMQLLSSLSKKIEKPAKEPVWVNQLRDLLHDQWQENFSLAELSRVIKIHPISISKHFPKYFQCTLGEYIRKIRIDKSLTLIKSGKENLSGIAQTCGFADQSHFIRVFKQQTGFLPKRYMKM